MLRQVMKKFDADHNVTVKPGDVVDVSNWPNAVKLENQGYLAPTGATKATVDTSAPRLREAKTPSAEGQQVVLRRSLLAGRKRVFTPLGR